jgi:methylenetetrahydrofolate dehydrogenase (NADP+)/methenyltetrahydrofolate cyclohydrolase
MTPVLLDGKALAAKMRDELKIRVSALTAKGHPVPVLATILVGTDPASDTYVKMKGKSTEAVGMESRRIHLPDTTTTQELLKVIDELNADDRVRGILLQHPVPHQIDERACFDRIAIEKDVDGVTTLGFGRISFGLDAFGSCTPAGIIRLLDEYKINVSGMNAVVIGRSPILGKPMAAMLLERNATVTICHSRTKDIAGILKDADIVVAALGKANFVKGEWLKEGVIVVDAGYNVGNVGDADYESCFKKASFITPVPGGVGPMTIATLIAQSVESAEKFYGSK